MCLTIDLQRLLEEKYGKTVANHSKNPFFMSNELDIETKAFAKMQRLTLLQPDYIKVKGDYKNIPKGLIWLCWHGFPKEYLSTDLDISRLVVLEMRNNSLKHVWHNSKECIIFGCEKLTEVEDVIKLEPIENFEVEQIESLFDMNSIRSIELHIYNYITDTNKVTTPQVFYNSSITSCFVFGSEVPILFEYRSKGSQIYFSLSQNPSEKVSWLNLCIVYSLASQEIFEFLPSVHIVNETKQLTWFYFSSFIGIPKSNSNIILWLIHWPVKDYQMENGDLVSCKLLSSGLDIKEFGVTYVSEKKVIREDDS
ncbi:TMV resistance protein N [Theobroma cacao]|uniref:TMV resistance protein N n=1 Tax=Theobroma cacao TaxID=3641 RepID=A0A061EZD9_THECC|nr:TMV resistance protein N [Theobroma cacao]